MIRVGLTGGIGSGKTISARIFEKLGVPVFYADTEAKKIMAGTDVRNQLVKILGDEAYEGNELNRKIIASKIFNDPGLLEKVNSVVHPAVHNEFLSWSEKHAGKSYVIEEAAILIESGAYKHFDRMIVVTSPEHIRIRRVMERDKLTEVNVRERLRNQLPEEEKLLLADYVINNDGDSMILPQILEIHEKLIYLYRK